MRFPARTRRILWLTVFVVGIVGLSLLLQDVFNELVAVLAGYEEGRPVSGPALFVLLAGASVMLGPFTSAPLMPFAVGVWGAGKTLALLLVGWALGNSAAYGIGYHFGHPIMGRIVSAEGLRKWMRFLREEVSVWGLFLIRLAAPAEIGYAFGILKYDFRKYLAIVLPAELPFALIVVYGGEAFLDGHWITLAGLVTSAFLIMGGAWLIANGRKKSRASSAGDGDVIDPVRTRQAP